MLPREPHVRATSLRLHMASKLLFKLQRSFSVGLVLTSYSIYAHQVGLVAEYSNCDCNQFATKSIKPAHYSLSHYTSDSIRCHVNPHVELIFTRDLFNPRHLGLRTTKKKWSKGFNYFPTSSPLFSRFGQNVKIRTKIKSFFFQNKVKLKGEWIGWWYACLAACL